MTTRSRWITTVLAGALVMFSSRQVAAQQAPSKHPTEQYEVERKMGDVSSKGLSAVKVKGVVKAQDDGTGMPGVNVVLKGTSLGTTTDVDGNFVLTVEDASSSPVLVFSFIGFQTLEDDVDVTKAEQVMEVKMVPEVMQLGGYVVGGATGFRWYSPRGLWWKVLRVLGRR